MDINELDLTILKVLMSNRKYALEFAAEGSEKLLDPNLWRFTKLVLEHIRTYKEVPTKRVLLEKAKVMKNEAFITHMNEVFAKIDVFNYDDKEYGHDLLKIKERYSVRLIASLRENISQSDKIDLNKSILDIKSTISNINSINQNKVYDQLSLKDSVDDFKNRYMAKLKDPNFGAGLATGYNFFDFTTGGLRPGEMLLIGADTGGGKSMLLMNMAINIWLAGNTIDMKKDFREGGDVLYLSLEMPGVDMQERVLSRLAMVPQKNIRDAKLTEEEQIRLSKALQFCKNYETNFTISDVARGASIDTLELIFNDLCQTKRKPKVVIIDYLTLMESKEKDMDDWLKAGKIAEQLHEFGRVHEIVMLSAVQLNDPGKNSDSQIGLHRIGRSKMIMHNANFGIQIEKRKDEEQQPDLNLHLIKSRRTELTRGKAFKNFSCCALLNDMASANQDTNLDDISDLIV